MHFKLAILLLVVAVHAQYQYHNVIDVKSWRYAMDQSKTAECHIHANEALHVVLDRICQLCHEMYSHENPNFRSECRANCFKSWRFTSCMNVFKPY
ncbi:unnamed protein product [Bursaphelenchus xylophilus]|uniref:(pine wood nematode) hypothetical protein n=1 Tax=Bursaphelenchus xylophilus TaxID=6326 RepID=A0A7I8WS33_BURXY|nr:unnamed protein product [Bursaphelenchus xylophilus]CAG9114790.1 unnamed protein product [Bursaphelenchus xylophilus]